MAEYILVDKNGNAYTDPTTGEVISIDSKDISDGSFVEDVAALDTYWGDSSTVAVDAFGITWTDQYAIMDGDENVVSVGTIYNKVPIKAGYGTEIVADANGETFSINSFVGKNVPWRTGKSGSAYLPQEVGLYEIMVKTPQGVETTAEEISFVIHWREVEVESPSAIISGLNYFVTVDSQGLIQFFEEDVNGNGGQEVVADVSYRRIGA